MQRGVTTAQYSRNCRHDRHRPPKDRTPPTPTRRRSARSVHTKFIDGLQDGYGKFASYFRESERPARSRGDALACLLRRRARSKRLRRKIAFKRFGTGPAAMAGPRRDDARDRQRRKGGAARSSPGDSLVRLVTKPNTGNTIASPLARPERLELPTLGFEDRYSIQLSYGRADEARHSTARPPLEASRRRSLIRHRIGRIVPTNDAWLSA